MAITSVNASYFNQGPSASGQILASNPASDTETALSYIGTATLDGTATTFTLNFLDGTKTLSFVPRAVTADIVGGTSAAVLGLTTSNPTSTGVTVNLSAAGTATQTVTIAGFILR